jgi:hypothetical protein
MIERNGGRVASDAVARSPTAFGAIKREFGDAVQSKGDAAMYDLGIDPVLAPADDGGAERPAASRDAGVSRRAWAWP